MKKALVVGNGPSRLALELCDYPLGWTIYACNGFYEEDFADYVVYGDPLITREIEKSGLSPKNPEKEAYGEGRWESAGGFALHAACYHGHDPVYMIGFDGGNANVYGDKGYHKQYTKTNWNTLWRAGMKRVRDAFPKVTIYQVNDKKTHLDGVFPRISYKEFNDHT